MDNYKKNGLEAPSVPVADSDGLIKTADLENDIIIHFPVWQGARPGDGYQLLINGAITESAVQFTDPIPDVGSMMSLVIPVATELLQDGHYSIGYRSISFPGLNLFDSKITIIRVDRTPPGAALLAPMIFPTATFGDTLLGVIPGYAGMESGDVIQTVCNEMHGPTAMVAPDHLTTSPMTLRFEREFLQNLENDEINVYYQVIDRAGNVSVPSNASTLTLTI